MQTLPVLAIFMEDEDTLIVFVHLEMVLKRFLLKKQKRFGLKSLRSLTLKGLKRYGYLNLLKLCL